MSGEASSASTDAAPIMKRMTKEELLSDLEQKRKENDAWLKKMEAKVAKNRQAVVAIHKDIDEMNDILDGIDLNDIAATASPSSDGLNGSSGGAKQRSSDDLLAAAEDGARRHGGGSGSDGMDMEGEGGRQHDGSNGEVTQSLTEMRALLEQERKRRQQVEADAKRQMEEQLNERKRIEAEQKARWEEQKRAMEEARRLMDIERQRQDNEDRHKAEIGKSRMARQAKRIEEIPTAQKPVIIGEEDPEKAERRRRRRAEKEAAERQKLLEQERRHQEAREKIGDALAREPNYDISDRDWIKDINDLASNADTVKKKVNTTEGDRLTFREKMIKFAAKGDAAAAAPST